MREAQMDELETVVGNQNGYKCPSCGSRHDLSVRSLIWTALVEDGSDPDGRTPDHDHYWDDDHAATCMACRWSGQVRDLEPRLVVGSTLHVVVFYGDEEIDRTQVFTSEAAALACRDEHVAENWDTYFEDQPMPDDPDAAADMFNSEAYGQGELFRMLTAEVEA
jgi:regulator of RNase E activity RraB